MVGARSVVIQRSPSTSAEVLADAGRGQHPAVAHEHHAVEAEAGADLVDLRGDGVGVAGRAFEDLDGDRTPGAVQSRPKTIWSVPFLRSRLWPRWASSQCVPST